MAIRLNFLFLNHYAGSPQHGMVYRTYYLARELRKMGQDVTVVGAGFTHLQTVHPTCEGPIASETIDGVPYVWLKTPPYEGNGPGRFLNLLAYCWRLATTEIPAGRPDVVLLSSPQPLAIWNARRIACKARARLLFEVRDLWPLTLNQLGGVSAWHPVSLFMQLAENYAYRKADRIISLLPLAKPYMVRHGMAPEKYVYIPNGVDESVSSGEPIPSLHASRLETLKNSGCFVIGYLGAHGNANALQSLVEAAAMPGFPCKGHIVLVGQGPEKQRLEQRVRQMGVDRISFLPPVPKGCVAELLSFFDILYIGLKNSPLFAFGVSPNKLMDYMSAAKPVVYAVGAGNDPVAECGCGISVPSENPGAIAKAIGDIAAMTQKQREAMGEKGRRYVLAHHGYSVLARQLVDAASTCC